MQPDAHIDNTSSTHLRLQRRFDRAKAQGDEAAMDQIIVEIQKLEHAEKDAYVTRHNNLYKKKPWSEVDVPDFEGSYRKLTHQEAMQELHNL